jgi:hypothetical protein
MYGNKMGTGLTGSGIVGIFEEVNDLPSSTKAGIFLNSEVMINF